MPSRVRGRGHSDARAALPSSGGGAAEVAAERPPRLLLNRFWVDHMPESARDELSLTLFLGGGIGIVQEGSSYRASFDVFDFERSGDRLQIMLLQDHRELSTRFQLTSCHEQPPFDLCLTLDESPRGPRRLYSFDDPDEMARHLPWESRAALAARAAAARR